MKKLCNFNTTEKLFDHFLNINSSLLWKLGAQQYSTEITVLTRKSLQPRMATVRIVNSINTLYALDPLVCEIELYYYS